MDIPLTSSTQHALGRDDEQWRRELTPEEYAVLRQAGTERPGSGKFDEFDAEGTYSCTGCGTELFRSSTKFDARCGWPAFYAPLAEDRIEYLHDESIPGRPRIETRCAACGSHLGHVFTGEGFDTPTDARFCINSVCLTFTPADGSASVRGAHDA
ncbi:peptide-methionine (R)-S-oxide reductase [Kytococcus aerolatus]|uniref:peptide-methionine (R)-S-oxide reductase n=1 Tax=Kytococcus aerolatus TaxID=592308 RepID=A0A212T3P3_9MICO|nr:peptide-methionine (R)-S-oxide reductase MsrB [Kytococcus aerolatus]SNC60466.1 peptide-methionine (R)-S-oxide reductase [Kytococcus aerolatus]